MDMLQKRHRKTFRIRCFAPDAESKDVPVEAASWAQALFLAKIDKVNYRYTDFGLLDRDDQIHRWAYKYGEPRARVIHRGTALRDALAPPAPEPAPDVRPKYQDEEGHVEVVSVNAMAKVLMESAIPQMPAGTEFMARDLVPKAPHKYQHLMKGHALSFAMDHLVSAGVVLRANRVRYLRNPELINMKLKQDEEDTAATQTQATPPATPPAPIQVEAQPAPEPTAPAVAMSEPLAEAVTPAEKIDAFLFVAKALMLDTRDRAMRFKEISGRLVELLEGIDEVHKRLEEFVREEEGLPQAAMAAALKLQQSSNRHLS